MLTAALFILSVAGLGLSQAPEGYRTVYITSMVDTKYVVVPAAPSPPKSGNTVVVQTLNNKPEQQWYLKADASKIQLAATQLCLDAGEKSNWKDMGKIWLKDCSDTVEGQQWNVMADGRIALVKSSPQQCIDLQYMRATPNNPVGLYACAGLGNTGAKDKGINWPLVNATTV
ncbi:carbohydrate-binding module family 13 protein [Aaosphaeria arxii CBS 175.79]|uniref:Carbohydrate-binding module family 13 protein n=1 Tax=Aaosphaeria arxii CBS 175.79 TaxID=1450172 RepID=A0A6A5XD26_9PLEO|nr:carbohydrate-binding module family 13 protein [Aaosphaeria arxii CBS 175.79]KAF2010707.1 carbohydrate-binding module family 13 protein [Aaosphaeria arxii CBS 175.79]